MPVALLASSLLLAGGVYAAVSMPTMLFFGTKKGTWINTIIYIAGFLGFNSLQGGTILSEATGNMMFQFLTAPPLWLPLLSLLIAVVLALLSVLISTNLYAKKEFLE